MSRTFTLVACNDFSVIKPDFLNEDELSEIEGLIEEVAKTPSHKTVNVEVFYMAFLDFENAPVEPATIEEIEILNDKLSDFLDEGYIQIVDNFIVPVNGAQEKIIEMMEM